jgi:hypothetical protein
MDNSTSISAKNSKAKAKGKKVVDPFCTQDSSEDIEKPLVHDAHDLVPDCTPEYKAKLQELLDAWPCNQHPGLLCMQQALNGTHRLVRFDGQLAWVLSLVESPYVCQLFICLHCLLVEKKRWCQLTKTTEHRVFQVFPLQAGCSTCSLCCTSCRCQISQ